MRKNLDDKISLFAHFQTPAPVGEVEGLKDDYKEYAKPEMVYQKGEKGKLKLVNSLNVEKVMADCPVVVEKFNNGEYGIANSGEKKTGFKKLLDKTVLRDQVKLKVIEDYNQNCN